MESKKIRVELMGGVSPFNGKEKSQNHWERRTRCGAFFSWALDPGRFSSVLEDISQMSPQLCASGSSSCVAGGNCCRFGLLWSSVFYQHFVEIEFHSRLHL